MQDFSMKINDKNGKTLCVSKPCGYGVSMVHTSQYNEGDRILLEGDNGYGYYMIRLDESMPESIVYLKPCEPASIMVFHVPTGAELVSYSPKSFSGDLHVITARKATKEEVFARRNLAFNPYDGHKLKNTFPHSHANVETRNEAVFAARNAIDGIYENLSHGKYPYSSWGINRDPNAALTIEFGRKVEVDNVVITLRADFPHDSYWTKGDVEFSDGSVITLDFVKSALPQSFSFEKKIIESIVFKNLIKADDDSPFPSLSQIEVYGKDIV